MPPLNNFKMNETQGSIGVFDSGYGGLTILRELQRRLQDYDWLYLGDNARAPYGNRSFEIVYEFTRQAVMTLFERGCHLVILACNTASAKALRTIQQQDLPKIAPERRVLGVIRPTVEALGDISRNGHIGILATPGTVRSRSYSLETAKLYPGMIVTETEAPMWAPLVENGEAHNPGADYFVKKYVDALLEADPQTDTIVLGCTHYPILLPKIRQYTPPHIRIIGQGDLVAESLADYLRRHPEIERRCTKGGKTEYLTTESPDKFNGIASYFMRARVEATQIVI